jgi:hypothetical protein
MQNNFSLQAMQDLLYPPEDTNQVQRKSGLNTIAEQSQAKGRMAALVDISPLGLPLFNDGWDQDLDWDRPPPTKFTVVLVDSRNGALTSGEFELRINCEMVGHPFIAQKEFEPAIYESVAGARLFVKGTYERC